MKIHVHSVIYNSQKGKTPKCSSTDEWINKTWHIHTMEYYLTIKKKNEVLYNTTTHTNLENMLNILHNAIVENTCHYTFVQAPTSRINPYEAGYSGSEKKKKRKYAK